MVIKEISPIDFLKRFLSYKKIIVIDIRSSSEYYQYHLKDSINIPINKLLNDYSYLLIIICVTNKLLMVIIANYT